MNCPGCTLPMNDIQLEALYGAKIEVDTCTHCNGIWFDGRESLQLSPGSTLKLFEALYAQRAQAHAEQVSEKKCPRCEGALVETQDLIKGTRFSYFRCAEHGRFTPFFQFLREKSFVRAPTPKELAELKAKVKQVDCSNCGAPISLESRTDCEHCKAPISILSGASLEATLRELAAKEEKRSTVAPDAALRMQLEKMKVESMYAQFDLEDRRTRRGGVDLVDVGMQFVFSAVKTLLR